MTLGKVKDLSSNHCTHGKARPGMHVCDSSADSEDKLTGQSVWQTWKAPESVKDPQRN